MVMELCLDGWQLVPCARGFVLRPIRALACCRRGAILGIVVTAIASTAAAAATCI